MTNALPIAKLGCQLVAGLGVTKIVADVVRNNVNVVTTADAVKVWAGSFVIGGIVVEQSSNYIERTTNELHNWYKKHKTSETTTE